MTVQNNAENKGNVGGVTGRGFRPGRSGNPGGRPKTATFAAEVRQFLQENVSHTDKPRLRRLLERLEIRKPEILLYFACGKPTECVELTGRDGVPLLDPQVIAAARDIAAKRYDEI